MIGSATDLSADFIPPLEYFTMTIRLRERRKAARRTTAFLAMLGGLLFLSPNVILADDEPPAMQGIRLSDDGQGFALRESGEPFVPWGFNFVGDHERIVEEYWEDEWPLVKDELREMKELGANVVRLHLQVGTYMKSPTEVRQEELNRLKRLLDFGREIGLYFDLTGLGCYHVKHVPDWYPSLSESKRWDVQARFWEAIAKTCQGHPAVFCYDLMNEPVLTGTKDGEHPWLTGELGGYYFVQTIIEDAGDRDRNEVAAAWVKKLTDAIRKHDPDHLITVGVIPWALVWPNAKPVFYAEEPAKHLDFVSVHFYPKTGEVDKAVKALAVYDIGKPIVVEETFPLSCSTEELDQFIHGTSDRADGWISHYFGKTIEEHKAGEELTDAIMADFLVYWREKGEKVKTGSVDAP